MTKEEFTKSNKFKIMMPVFLAAMAIYLWEKGYYFGQWLYDFLH